MAVVGESRRQTALRNLSAGRRERYEQVHFTVVLRAEPDNEYDPNAIAVHIQSGGAMVGYLAREDAEAYQQVFLALAECRKSAVCRARLIGGTATKPSFGVMIDLDAPATLLERVSPQPF